MINVIKAATKSGHGRSSSVADPDFDLRRGGGGGFTFLAQPAFLSSVISSFFTQNGGWGGLP